MSVEEQFSRPWRDFLCFSFPGTCFAACRATFSRAYGALCMGSPEERGRLQHQEFFASSCLRRVSREAPVSRLRRFVHRQP